MANTISYPTSAVKSSDLILGTSIPDPNTNNDPKTVNFPVSDVIALVPDIPFTSLTTTGTSGVATLVSGVLNIPNYTTSGGGGVASVGLAAPSAFIVSNSPVTGVGTLTLTGAGLTTEYIDGTGALQTFPSIPAAQFTSLTTTGASGDTATLVSGVLNIPTSVIPFTGLTTYGSAGSAFLSPEGILNIPTPNLPQTITLTTNGTSGASTLVGGVLNVPNYTTSGSGVTSITAGTNIEISPTSGNVIVSAPDSVENSADVWPSAPKVTQIVTMSQAEYDQGGALNSNWLVIIVQ